ncbi:MAG: tRNA (adenosine(37)-N6)-dimethylallyltransferase MiaA [Acidobacteriota bacterium]
MNDSPLVAVVGPTGSGKSELTLSLAKQFGGEILNCDSVQVFRYFEIGTAKLRLSERQGIPHHLLDFVDPDEVFTAGDYSRLGRSILAGIAGRGRLPIVCGGTGFYLRSLLDGLFEGPGRDDELRHRLLAREAARPGVLHRILKRLDPVSAARIHANDTTKLLRALEVRLLTRRPMTTMFQQGREQLRGFATLKLGINPPREELYKKLDERANRMFDSPGIVEETQSILALGFASTAKPFTSIGYAQALRLLRGESTREEAIEATQRQTRQYAKRQWTWFRREQNLVWLDGFGSDSAVQDRAAALVEAFLARK